jgi:hypothetical protein
VDFNQRIFFAVQLNDVFGSNRAARQLCLIIVEVLEHYITVIAWVDIFFHQG